MSAPTDGLSERARGWLRFLWDKATTPDDWSSGGEPHAWWDRVSTPPMCAFPRFDLWDTSYALPVMAEATPAWREVYARIARELVERHTTFWAAIDWLTLIGPDPGVDRYPPEWQIFAPAPLQGRYPLPGWTANGVEPWGLQPDPIGADGFLGHRGFFDLLLGVYRYLSGDDRWDQPFSVSGYQDRAFSWTHPRIAELVSAQMAARPQGPHCENTKIWPLCVSGAGLGLQQRAEPPHARRADGPGRGLPGIRHRAGPQRRRGGLSRGRDRSCDAVPPRRPDPLHRRPATRPCGGQGDYRRAGFLALAGHGSGLDRDRGRDRRARVSPRGRTSPLGAPAARTADRGEVGQRARHFPPDASGADWHGPRAR